ncbi:SDR family NAD(P)-dependent oxidoreductase [Lysinibacillus sp. NPDC058147]|uniref:SDR family NAD(P)-dependent oxidoreductase n=1 Tax=unclassified Lysinibacillus TaxID=2636778 RepID=UPI0036DC8762
MNNVYKFIVENIKSGKIDRKMAVQLLSMMKSQENKSDTEIAIIGMSLKLPYSETYDEYWQNIINRYDLINPFPESRKQDIDDYFKSIGKWSEDIRYCEGAFLQNIDEFDNGFFKFSPKEASLMDPNQRLFMETAMKAIEDAGYGGDRLVGANVGVFVGFANTLRDSYGRVIYDNDLSDPTAIIGNLSALIPSRLSYFLDLKGPSLTVDTACSSSLVSVALACQAIRSGQCDMALAGGLKLNIIPLDKENEKIGLESSDSRTRAFDDLSDGTGIGEGVGVVMLKPLRKAISDGDNIHAVLKGFSVNQDGQSMGITAPNPAAHTDVLVNAWKDANINPEDLDYIETHGTGTNIGDPIEIKGIHDAFRKYTNKSQFCGITSVKSNMGHLYEGAGIANLIKAVMALKQKRIPPSVYFNKPNQSINFVNSPVYVNTQGKPWHPTSRPRLCGVSSFGVGGTNCHMVLEEAPEQVDDEHITENDQEYVFTLSAKSKEAFNNLLESYKQYPIEEHSSDIRDICYTSSVGRGHYEYRLALIVNSLEDLKTKLNAINPESISNQHKMYSGHHKVVSKLLDSNGSQQNYITKKEVESLSRTASQLMIGAEVNGGLDVHNIKRLCELYTNGAVIDWMMLYQDDRKRIVNLPTYCFDRHRNWVVLPDANHVPDSIDSDLFYTMNWISEDINQPNQENEHKAILVLKDSRGIGDALVNKLRLDGKTVVEVVLGQEFKRVNQDLYVIGNGEASYDQLIQAVKTYEITSIVHLLTLQEKFEQQLSPDNVDEELSQGVYSLFYLTRAIVRQGLSQNIWINLVSEYANEVTGNERLLKPVNVSLFGMGKVVSQEYPNIKCKCIDIDVDSSASDIILKEMNHQSKDYQVAYRDGIRYLEQFTEVNVNNVPNRTFNIKSEGAYVITGGTGGIGLEIAKYFVKNQNVNLALINRSAMPDRQQWKAILAERKNGKLCHKIQMILDIEALGATVSCYQADVSDVMEMSVVTEEIRRDYGVINGVIHSAGNPGDGYILRKEKEIFDSVIAPKIKGTLVLDQVTANDQLDFFVVFSSGVSIIGEVGQSDYVAANAFLDSYAAYRTKLGKPTLSIDWVSWKTVGMSVEYGFNVDLIFKAIDTDLAISGFDTALKKDINRVLIGELNIDSEYLSMLENLSFRLSKKTSEVLDRSKKYIRSRREDKAKKPNYSLPTDIKLVGKDSSEYSETEMKIAAVYREILGFSEIDVNDSFFELGGDSVMLTRMHAIIEEQFPNKVKVSDLFAHTSVYKLAEFIDGSEEGITKTVYVQTEKVNTDDDIAIIGMSVEMPLAEDHQEYWQLLRNGTENIRRFPSSRRKDIDGFLYYIDGTEPEDLKYVDGSFLDHIDKFDYKFFKMTPAEAKYTDPFQRLLMKTIWRAIEDAGYGGGKLAQTNTGIYVGFASSFKDSYQRMIYETNPEMLATSAIGNITAMMPTRISYFLDLKGPTMVIDTACSSTLVALHTACMAIKNNECDNAIVGGVRISLMPLDRQYTKIGIESSDGRTLTFDNHANGSGFGEGSSAVIIKPLKKALADGDHIYSVIKGSAINQDGASMGITAPNPDAQTEVILKAWEKAGINPEELAFVEAHGTGTALGDPIEIDALQRAFKQYTEKKQFCAIGSVKSNTGHLFEGAGLASLIKAALSLKNKEIPASLNFNIPNNKINFAESSVYVNTKLKKWNGQAERMKGAVSSFGFSGTNCHVVLEEPPLREESQESPVPNLLTLSARSEEALKQLIVQYKKFFNSTPSLNKTNICFTSNTGRDHFNYRLALVVNTRRELIQQFEKINVSDLNSNTNEGVFYGVFHEISSGIGESKSGQLTARKKQELNRKVKEKLADLELADVNTELLGEVGQLYVSGADIDWEVLYDQSSVQKASLPTYIFDQVRCWLDMPDGRKAGSITEEPDQFYTMAWQVEKLKGNLKRTEDNTVLIFSGEDERSKKVVDYYKESGVKVIQVKLGSDFEKISNEQFMITGHQEDYVKLFDELKSIKINKIIHMFTVEPRYSMTNINQLEESQHIGVYSLFYLTKSIALHDITWEIDVALVSSYVHEVNGFEEEIIPEQATLEGFGKVVRKEHPNLICRFIDIDRHTSMESLSNELDSEIEWYNVAFRKDVRYVEVFKEINENIADERPIEISSDGVYVITGGAGGIGLEVSKYLASNQKVNLALLNRSSFPPREDWDRFNQMEEDQSIIRKICEFQEIEQNGSIVDYYSVNVTDEIAVEQVFSELREKYGKINGIVHAAGVGGAEPISTRTIENFNQVFTPKVHGTWILDKVSQSDDLDFFLLFSSIATMFSMPGQGDYIAANAYLDSYTAYRNKQGKRTITINWSTWKETGMSVHHNFNIDTLFKAILTKDAINGLQKILNLDVPRTLIGELNYESKIIFLLDKFSTKLSEKIHHKFIEVTGQKNKKQRKKNKMDDHSVELVLSGRDEDEYMETEKIIAGICKDVLGFDEINIYDNFFELGADSILLTRMHQHLDEKFPGAVAVTDIFEYTSIFALAEYINANQKEQDSEPNVIKKQKDIDHDVRNIFDSIEEENLSMEDAINLLKDI